MAYTLSGQKSGIVRFTPFKTGLIDKESESYSSSVTNSAVETGADINDHVNNASGTITISGVIIGGEQAVQTIKDMRDSRDILTYTGKTRISNLVFTQLKFDRTSSNIKGAYFTATLKEIKLVSADPLNLEQQSMVDQDSGKFNDKQLSKTSNVGLTTLSVESISSGSYDTYVAFSYDSGNNPSVRHTDSYDGLS